MSIRPPPGPAITVDLSRRPNESPTNHVARVAALHRHPGAGTVHRDATVVLAEELREPGAEDVARVATMADEAYRKIEPKKRTKR